MVIFLGMLEKAFFVAMYTSVNQSGSHSNEMFCCVY